MKMKKTLSAALAAMLALGAAVPAFAAVQTKEMEISSLSGGLVLEDGTQQSLNTSVLPSQTVYFLLPDSIASLVSSNKDYRLSVRKQRNSKLVKSVEIVEKRLTSSKKTVYLPNVASPANRPGAVANDPEWAAYSTKDRNTYLAVELNDTTSDQEYKIQLTATLTVRKDNVSIYYGNKSIRKAGSGTPIYTMNDGDKLALNVSFFVANQVQEGEDSDVTVGKTGKTIKPARNSENTVTFEGEDTLAVLSFKANSSPEKFYAKLTTKWPSGLLSKFQNTDAVVRQFSAATIPASSRATLSLVNPFSLYDVDPEDVYIYWVSSTGKLTNVTDSFWYDEDEDAFLTKTRTLGTWVISDGKVSTK